MTQSIATRLEQLCKPYPLIALAVINFFFYADRFILFILVEPIKHEFMLSDKEIGLLTGLAFGISYCLFAIPLGRLADSSSRVLMIATASVGWSLAMVGFAVSGSYATMLVLRAGVAAGEAAGYIATQSIVADLYAPQKRARALSVIYSAGMVGMIFAYAVVGRFSEGYGWRNGFMLLGLIGLALGPIIYFTVREPERGAQEGVAVGQEKIPLVRALKELWRRKSFVMIVVGYMAASVTSAAAIAWLPAYLQRRFDLSLSTTGLVVSAGSVGPMLLGLMTAGLISAPLLRRNPKWVLWLPAVGTTAAAVFQFMQVQTGSLTLAIVAGAVPAFISGVYIPPLMAAMQSISGARLRGTAAAMIAVALMLVGQGLGPSLVGLLSDVFGSGKSVSSFAPIQQALAATSGLYLLTTILLLVAARYIDGDTNTARSFDESTSADMVNPRVNLVSGTSSGGRAA